MNNNQFKNLFGSLRQPPAKTRPRKTFIRKLLSLVKRFIIGDEPKIRLQDNQSQKKQRRLASSVGGVLLFLLLVSVFFGWRRRVQLSREEKVATVSQKADWVLSQAEQLSAVSPSRARQLLEDESLKMEKSIENESDRVVIDRVNEFIDRLRQAQSKVGRVTDAEPELYLDLGLIRAATSGSVMQSTKEQLLILDTQENVLLTVSINERNGTVAGGGESLSGSRAVGGTLSAAYVLTSKQIVEVILGQKTSTPVISAEEVWQDPSQIAAFAGNIYLFDRGSSEIYKYPAIENVSGTAFGSRRRWLGPGVTPDLTDVVDMAIDGDAWLLHSDGKISRFRRGAPLGFIPKGLIEDFTKPIAISVPVDGSRVWILDAGRDTIVALDRETGDYAGQWAITGLEIKDFVINEAIGRAFLLTGEKIYTIKI